MNFNNSNNIIKIEAKHEYTLFPKYPLILGKGENNYGIVKWCLLSVLEGEPIIDKNDCVTVTGNYHEEIDSSKTYTILAKETDHPQYGKQYQLIFIGEILNLSNIGNQRAFLKTFLTNGQIEEMFKVLENPLKTIQEHDIESLKKVHGIGDYIGKRIIDRYERGKDYCNVYLELDDLGLTPKFIQKLISEYHNPNKIIKIVKENPYQLSFDIEGIGFRTADKIALNNGMDNKSPERIKGYINYLLCELGEKGNSYITAGELTAYIFEEFGGKENILEIYTDENGNKTNTNIGVAMTELQKNKIIVVENNEKKTQRKVYLKKYWYLENHVANELKRIGNAENDFEFVDWQEVVKNQEQKQGWKFTNEQLEGIEACLNSQIVFITGLGGTGKSSVLTGVLQALRCYEGKYSFAQCALSGRAGARMQEITGQEGSTIHRLLGFKPGRGFAFNTENKLPYDIIIIDEISLVGGEIFLSLLEAIESGSKLIILGDLGQLESIGCMNLAKDLYYSKFIKVIELTKIHRQAQKSGIIVASHAIRNGEHLFKNNYIGEFTIGELQDMHFSIHSDRLQIREDVIKYFKKYWNNKVKNIMDIQILVPVKERGDACVFNLNSDIQKIYNPPHRSKLELKFNIDKHKSFVLRQGDKVMNLKNNYKLFNTKGENIFVFNGWIGTLESINKYDSSAIIYFPIIDDRIIFNYSDLKENVTLGYVSTVHKYQGSSAKLIIGAVDYSTPPSMRTKELLYTLLTRAEKECVLIGQNKAINDAINTSGVSDKNTFLVELLDAA